MERNLPTKYGLVFVLSIVLFANSACDEQDTTSHTNMMGLRVGQVLGDANIGGGNHQLEFDKAQTIREFKFPADHGPHRRFASEWWYLTLILNSEEGGELGLCGP